LAERDQAEPAREGLWLLDARWSTLFVTPTVAEMLGYTPCQMLGRPLTDFMDEDSRALAGELRERRQRGVAEVYVFRFRRHDSGALWTVVRASPILGASGRFVGSLGVITEVAGPEEATRRMMQAEGDVHETARRWLQGSDVVVGLMPTGRSDSGEDASARECFEAQLKRDRDAAEAKSQAKSVFVANVSHELRTHLNGLLGMLDLASREPLPPRLGEQLRVARGSADQLLAIVNDLLDFAKIEANKIHFRQIPFDLRGELDGALRPFVERACVKGLSFDSSVEADVPELLIGDPVRLRQIVVNLVDNAVKFTERGGVSVRVWIETRAQPYTALAFEIEDTGIGIPEARLESIFAPFEQAEATTSEHYGGTGLGLTITQRLCERMGGQLRVQSVVGQGSVFRFTACFELAVQAMATSEPTDALPVEAAPSAPRRLQVLLAEDNAINRLVAAAMLEDLGHSVEVVSDGKQVLEVMARERFDLVLMDVQMPEMGGLETTVAVREMERERGQYTPIVAMTARAMKEDEARCLRAGMDAYMSKPIDRRKLAQVIALFEGGAGRPKPAGVVFDRDALVERMRDRRDLLRQLVEMFVVECARRMDEIRGAVASGDVAALEWAAHRLVGMVGSMEAPRATEAARVLEQMAHEGDLSHAPAALAALEEEIASVSPQIAALKAEL